MFSTTDSVTLTKQVIRSGMEWDSPMLNSWYSNEKLLNQQDEEEEERTAFLPFSRPFNCARSSSTPTSTEAKRILTPFSHAMTAIVTDCLAAHLYLRYIYERTRNAGSDAFMGSDIDDTCAHNPELISHMPVERSPFTGGVSTQAIPSTISLTERRG